MKKTLVNSVALLSVFLMPLAFSSPAKGITIQTWKTKNEVPVYFVRRPEIPMVDINLVYKAGSSQDGDHFGLASLTSSLLGEGTTTQSATEIATSFDRVGAQFGVNINRDMAVASLRTLTDSKYFQPAVTNFIDVLTHASFPAKAFSRVKDQSLTGIKQDLQSPFSVAKNSFYQSVYANQPYGHPVSGTLNSVQALTRAESVQFYQSHFGYKNLKIVIVGALEKQAAMQLADQISQRLFAGKAAADLPSAGQAKQNEKVFVSMPVTQNSIFIGELGIDRKSPNYFNLMVANHVLGGLPMTSILFNRVRNQEGLVYGVSSVFVPLALKGPFMIVLQTRTAKSTQAIDLVRSVLADYLQSGPTEQQLTAAKLNLLGSFPLKLSSNSGVGANVINIAAYNMPLDYLQNYPANIKKVTQALAKAAFDQAVVPDKLNTIMVGQKPNGGSQKQS